MMHCPHCQTEADLFKVGFSSKKKPYACPSCGEFSELPAGQPVVLILILGLGLAAQLDHRQIDQWVGSGSGVFLLSFLLAWLYLRFCCELLPLNAKTVAQRSELKVSWVLGGPITPTSFLIYSALGLAAAFCHSYFVRHVPLSAMLPVGLLALVILGIVYFVRFRR
jgi:hypothetical protein